MHYPPDWQTVAGILNDTDVPRPTGAIITLPAAGLVGAVMFLIGNTIGGLAGPMVIFAILCALAGYMVWHANLKPVNAGNVNDEWDDTRAAVGAGDGPDSTETTVAPSRRMRATLRPWRTTSTAPM